MLSRPQRLQVARIWIKGWHLGVRSRVGSRVAGVAGVAAWNGFGMDIRAFNPVYTMSDGDFTIGLPHYAFYLGWYAAFSDTNT